MQNGLIAQALTRREERPDIHKPVAKVRSGESFRGNIAEMVRDLKEHVPGLSVRQLSTLIGVSVGTVHNNHSEHWTTDDNESASAAHLSALRKHHECYRDEVSYILFDGKTADRDEWSTVPAVYTTPEFRDPYRRADQSHTIKRPITLATRPFSVAA
jgi:hypothetical protein